MKRYSFARTFLRILPMVFRAVPVVYPASMLAAIAAGLGTGFVTTLMQRFFDMVARYVQGDGTVGTVVRAAAVLGGLTVGLQLFQIVRNFLGGLNYNKLNGAFMHYKHEKSGRLRADSFENTAQLDLIEMARWSGSSCMNLVFLVVDTLTQHLPYFLYMGIYMASLNPMLALVIPLVFVPSLVSLIVNVGVLEKMEWEAAPQRRQLAHYEACMAGREHSKETRVLGVLSMGYFGRLFAKTLKSLATLERTTHRKVQVIETLLNLVTIAGYGGILYLLFSSVMSGAISVGAFAAVFASVDNMFAQMDHAINRQGIYMSYNLAPAKNFLRFLDLPEQEGTPGTFDAAAGIKLENVSYAYPGAANNALENITLSIAPQETIALVGENGAGKTTLVRLLTGLFLPSEGKVVAGGLDTSTARPADLYAGMSAVFQDYQRYQLTLGENIAISDMHSTEGPAAAAVKADLHTEDTRSFPQGLETMLSREFDGVDLSGGQWQRVAIARGLYRDHAVIVLDEPTAAIDPLEETKVYEQFAEISQDKMAVIVTHRLGSARVADRIVVMEGGRIDDIGTHDALLAREGLYARMYREQAQWYV